MAADEQSRESTRASVEVFGASDDLIEVEGALCEEFNALNLEEGGLLAFSDGTLLRVIYDQDGIWRITRLAEGKAEFEKDENPPTDDERYSDRVTLTGDLRWVVFGKEWARA